SVGAPFRWSLSGWGLVVTGFSTGNLTFPSDRLSSFSGVAKGVQSNLPGTYMAGMWKEHLPKNLFWYVAGSSAVFETETLVPTQYIAPTWTWMLILNRVRVH